MCFDVFVRLVIFHTDGRVRISKFLIVNEIQLPYMIWRFAPYAPKRATFGNQIYFGQFSKDPTITLCKYHFSTSNSLEMTLSQT